MIVRIVILLINLIILGYIFQMMNATPAISQPSKNIMQSEHYNLEVIKIEKHE